MLYTLDPRSCARCKSARCTDLNAFNGAECHWQFVSFVCKDLVLARSLESENTSRSSRWLLRGYRSCLNNDWTLDEPARDRFENRRGKNSSSSMTARRILQIPHVDFEPLTRSSRDIPADQRARNKCRAGSRSCRSNGFPLSRTSLTRSKLPKRNSRIFLVKSPRQDPKDLKVRHAFQSRSSNAWQPGRKAAAVTWSAVYITATRPATRIDTDASCTRRPVKRCRLISTGPRWAWAP